jgi:hypothetical protein
MLPSITAPCFDFRGVPPGDRCTLVDFRRELLPIFSASTMEVGVAEARADEQRRAGIGPDGDSICLNVGEEWFQCNKMIRFLTSTLVPTSGLRRMEATSSLGHLAAAASKTKSGLAGSEAN